MKTLENHTLLYDEDCPLCQSYTSTFVKYGVLDKEGRKPFHTISANEQQFVDLKRATNEIALIDTENKTVLYGIDGLLKIFGTSFPIIEKIGNSQTLNLLLKKLYKFISYNRKVIAPSKKRSTTELDCTPDFNFKYRWLYIVFGICITISVLNQFSQEVNFLPKASILREILLTIGQIVFQWLFLLKCDNKTILNYIGNLTTVSLIGSLLLLPILIISSFVSIHPLIVLTYFGVTVLLMIKEHYRRTQLLELPKYLTITWLVYRIIALLIIIKL